MVYAMKSSQFWNRQTPETAICSSRENWNNLNCLIIIKLSYVRLIWLHKFYPLGISDWAARFWFEAKDRDCQCLNYVVVCRMRTTYQIRCVYTSNRFDLDSEDVMRGAQWDEKNQRGYAIDTTNGWLFGIIMMCVCVVLCWSSIAEKTSQTS